MFAIGDTFKAHTQGPPFQTEVGAEELPALQVVWKVTESASI